MLNLSLCCKSVEIVKTIGEIRSDATLGSHCRCWFTTMLSALDCNNMHWCTHTHLICRHNPEALCIDWTEQQTISNSIYKELGVKNRHFKQSESKMAKRVEECMNVYVVYENVAQRNLKKKKKKELSRIKLRAVYWVCVRGWRPLAASNYESFPRHAPLTEPLDGIKRPQGPSLRWDKGDVIYKDLCKADRSAN